MISTHLSRHCSDTEMHCHRHQQAYAALVLRGHYHESSPDGLWRCEAGDLVLHPGFHLHCNRIGGQGARVLNFELPAGFRLAPDLQGYGVFQLGDPGRVERLARRNPLDALMFAVQSVQQRDSRLQDCWLDQCAQVLGDSADAPSAIGALAQRFRVSAEHLSRQFRARFGMPPSVYRRERRLHQTLELLARPQLSLAAVAVDAGYADQPHMTRELRRLTGYSPRQLRQQSVLA